MKNKIKKFISLFLLLSIFSNFVCYASETRACEWYVKRNGCNSPDFPKEATEIDKYNCYYIDKTACNNKEKRLYLTFDAGYENGNIEKILDVLKEENVPAAFFILDNIILKNTDLVNRMADEGHLVCNHTKKHAIHTNSTKEEIKKDLQSLEDLYTEKTGKIMSKFFRFPEGKYSINALRSVCELGYTTVFWSFGYDDWDNNRQMNSEKAKKKILENTHNGAIFLFHPTSDTNATIMKDLIISWRELGYSFGSLDEL